MSGNKLLLDTNTILYVLAGNETLATFLNEKELYVSIITELELLSYKKITSKEIRVISDFLDQVNIININDEIKTETIELRRKSNLKLPDSIIGATSLVLDIPLVTSDKQMATVSELNIVLFEI
jgi:predicted nucleic acid-binding protein